MFSSEHRKVVLRAIAHLERKIDKTRVKEAEIADKMKQTISGGFDDLERLNWATQRIVLTAKREASEMALAKLRSNMAPIRALPMELLTEIFLLAVADQEEVRQSLHGQPLRLDYHWSEYNEHRMTLPTLTVQEIISHVCQHWRDVSLAVPSLWRKLIFAVYESETLTGETYYNFSLIQRMEVWVNRTKNVPLDITFWNHRTPVLEIWKVLRQLSHRFRSLRVYDQNVATLQEITASLLSTPLLESLHLGCLLKNENTMWKANLRLPHGIKCRLRELSLEKVSLPWAKLPLSRITKLVILGRRAQLRIPYAQLNYILNIVAPRLEWFAYQDLNKPDLRDEPYDSKLEFPSLKILEVNIVDVRFLVHWLNAFSFPSLKRVYFDIQTESGVEFRSLLTAVKNRKVQRPTEKPRIALEKCEELTMGPCGKAALGIGAFIGGAFPALRKFHSHAEGAPFALEEIFETFQTKCPELVEVQAYQCGFLEIHRLVNARLLNAEVTSLSNVFLDTVPDWSSSEVARLRESVKFVVGDPEAPQVDLMDYEEYGPNGVRDGTGFYGQTYTNVSSAYTESLNSSDDDAEMSSSPSE